MTSPNVLNLDYREETDISHPLPPLVSSREAGWNHLQLVCYQVPAEFCLPENRAPHHLICINYGDSLISGELTVEGKPTALKVVPGGIGIYPANLTFQEFWSSEAVSFLDLYLEPALLEHQTVGWSHTQGICPAAVARI